MLIHLPNKCEKLTLKQLSPCKNDWILKSRYDIRQEPANYIAEIFVKQIASTEKRRETTEYVELHLCTTRETDKETVTGVVWRHAVGSPSARILVSDFDTIAVLLHYLLTISLFLMFVQTNASRPLKKFNKSTRIEDKLIEYTYTRKTTTEINQTVGVFDQWERDFRKREDVKIVK